MKMQELIVAERDGVVTTMVEEVGDLGGGGEPRRQRGGPWRDEQRPWGDGEHGDGGMERRWRIRVNLKVRFRIRNK